MKVYIAIKTGFYGGSLKAPGVTFLAPDEFKSSWAKRADDAAGIAEATEPGILDGSVSQISEVIPSLSDGELRKLLDGEMSGKMRKGVVARLEDELATRAMNPSSDDLLS